jgi:hypothetical protein
VSLLLRLDQPSRIGRFGTVTNEAALAAHARRALANADWIAAAFTGSVPASKFISLDRKLPTWRRLHSWSTLSGAG